MKKSKKVLFLAVVILCFFAILCPAVQAKKSKVTYSLSKSGTLTIKGKGAMPSSMTFQKNKKIKKVVIKKGVTSIPVKAFYKCKNIKSIEVANTVKKIGQEAFSTGGNLNKLTIPGDFKIKLMGDDDAFYYLGSANTVVFSTKLTLENAAYLNTGTFKLYKKDPKYKSIDGVIYTKDGTEIVRVPWKKKELVIADGCKIFHLWAVGYATGDGEGDSLYGCTNLEKITIPSSVTMISDNKYQSKYDTYTVENFGEIPLKKLVIKTKNLDAESINALVIRLCKNSYNRSKVTVDQAMAQVSSNIEKKNGMYVSKDGYLIKYVGNSESVTVPDGVKVICDQAFYNQESKVKEISLPKTLTKIGNQAFCYTRLKKISLPDSVTSIGEYAFDATEISEIKIPNSMTEIGKQAFAGMQLKEITIPDTITVIGEEAFAYCPIEKVTFGKNVKEIQRRAFWLEAKSVDLPESVTIIESDAFVNVTGSVKSVTIRAASTKNIHSNAFPYYDEKMVITYKADPDQYQTNVRIDLNEYKKKKSNLEIVWNRVSGASGYQVQASTDSKMKENVKTVTVNDNQTFLKKITITNKKNTEVYARVRPYTIVDGKKVYGRWSSVTE
jgi:hypothetical protein